jgi:VTC domain-containing protein
LYSMRSHVQRRRRRWKVRQRWYVEDDLCRIEVKTKNGRGETVKATGPSSVQEYGRLGDDDLAFVESVLASGHPELRIDELVPCAEVTYVRATLADLAAGTRVTIDWGLEATLQGGSAWIDDQYVLIETKGGVVPARADRVLTRLGGRQRSFSKSVAATSLVRNDIPDNDVRSLRGTSLHVRLHAPEGLS